MIAPRLLIAGICLPFLFSGVAKLLDFDGAIAEFASFGFPVPALFAALTTALQLGASAATVIAHSHQLMIFVEHLSLAFGLVFVAWWNWRPRERRAS